MRPISCHPGPAHLSRSPVLSNLGNLRVSPFTAALALFLLLAALYPLSSGLRATRGANIAGDEPFYLLTTQSLLQDGDLDLTNQYARRSYTKFFDSPRDLWTQSVPRPDGALLSPHDPGLSVYVIPGFALGGLAGVRIQLALTAALAMALTFVLVARLTSAPALSWLVTLGVALAATPFIYSTAVYPEFPAALALVASLLVLTSDGRPGLGRAFVFALLAASMLWLGVKYAPLALLTSAAFLWKAAPSGRWALLGLGAFLAAPYVWFHLDTFGGLTPYEVNTIYAGDSTVQVLSAHVSFASRFYRLWGLFIDQRFGVGRWAPLLLLAVPGLVPTVRRGGVPVLIVALILAQLLIATFVAITMMGWWFPGRTLMTVLPLLTLPIVLLLKDTPISARVRPLALILGLYSIAVTFSLASAGHIFTAVNPFDLSSPLFRGLSFLFPDYRSWSPHTWAATTLWLALAAAAMGPRLPQIRRWDWWKASGQGWILRPDPNRGSE